MLQIHAIPAFDDNYFWLLQPNAEIPKAYVIDPGSAEPVLKILESKKLNLEGILITHHHRDHIGGALSLSQLYKAPIYGPKSTKIPEVSHPLYDGDLIQLEHIQLQIMALPGHTLDHIGYYFAQATTAILFCGDTLFAGGCGRLFDGTAATLFQSLQLISKLPDQTLIYCAHEYTETNLRFAVHIEPNNSRLVARQIETAKFRNAGLPSIPSRLDLEKQTNPFLRCHLPQVRHSVERLSNQTLITELEVFTQLRLLKDQYR
jgi:hydroxyacylglutathione hydrolase